jgi:tRNA-dihydrouridine synthase
MIKIDFAPLEGLTDSIYRRQHHAHFGGVDRYFMPFLSPTMHKTLTHKEDRELPMADSVAFSAVPQILTKVPEDFLWAAQVCADRGYSEVNLNTGCPSGTVVSKGKGAGMLANAAHLDAFLDEIFSKSPIPVSVKTRIGMTEAEEFPRLLEIFNQYPIKELILHPRTRKDFYKAPIHMDAFAYAYAHCNAPLSYNGDLCSLEDIAAVKAQFPKLQRVMVGRGLVGDPGMLTANGTTAEALEAFHRDLIDDYICAFGSARNAMFRLKENWHHLICRFEGGEKLYKSLRKTTDIDKFMSITTEIFRTLPLAPRLTPDWLP